LMNDDLNTPGAVGELFEALSAANALADDSLAVPARRLAQSINILFGAMGLALLAGSQVIDDESARLVEERDLARTAKDWSEADRLRLALTERGWIVEDGALGTVIRRP
jgi:cysteinyl-tRNA synthetase